MDHIFKDFFPKVTRSFNNGSGGKRAPAELSNLLLNKSFGKIINPLHRIKSIPGSFGAIQSQFFLFLWLNP